jgi:hypothetical protein
MRHNITKSATLLIALSLPIAITSLSATAAPLQGEGSMAAIMYRQATPPVTDVAWRNNYWVPGAVAAGVVLGAAALAAPGYPTGYCDPNYNNCGSYPGNYSAYYTAPPYG